MLSDLWSGSHPWLIFLSRAHERFAFLVERSILLPPRTTEAFHHEDCLSLPGSNNTSK